MSSKFFILLLVLSGLLLGCERNNRIFEIPLLVSYQQQTLSCDSHFTHQGQWQLQQLFFYISKVAIKTEGQWRSVKLANNQWQNDDIALLGEECGSSGHWSLDIDDLIDESLIQGLRFELGVPFNKNHNNPLQASGILSNSNMFWSWQMGYKFFRLDLVSLDNKQNDWAFHLGSTGCRSASAMRTPDKVCANPNRVKITLDDYQAGSKIKLDLAMLLQGIKMGQQSRCLSMPTQDSCPTLFGNIGLLGSGQSIFELTYD